MAQAVINLVNAEKLGEFYFTKNMDALAMNYLVEGRYTEYGPYEFDDAMTDEEIAEELFDLTNNPWRQDEREEKYGRGRSLSVGDVVVVNGNVLLCAPTGWRAIDLARV